MRKNNKGVTFAEVLIVVAIIVALSSVAFVAVWQYQRSMHQLEMDEAAKEIFVAAQNHISVAESQGFLGASENNGDFGYAEVDQNTGKNTGIYYIIVNGGETQSGRKLLDMMLPFASIDETVRLSRNYIIRYNASPALIMDVFCSTMSSADKKFGHEYTTAEYQSLIDNYRFDEHKKDRRKYEADDSVLGYYGGVEAKALETITLQAPTAFIHNEETLWVEINDPNASDTAVSGDRYLSLIITGETSGVKYVYPIVEQGSYNLPGKNYAKGDDTNGKYEITLDDITANGLRFTDMFGENGSIQAGFYPGENLKVQAVSFSNSQLSNIAYSAEARTSSLFADINSNQTAYIANARHLENLDQSVSGFKTDINGDNDANGADDIKNAEQTADISWSDFLASSKTGNTVYYGTGTTHTDSGKFKPIDPEGTISYNGNMLTISDVSVSENGDAGLFSALESGDKVEKVELVDFTIKSENGKAGALAASAEGADISGVLVHNDNTSDDLQKKIEGKQASGGLVGEMTGGSVTASAAAVWVNSSEGAAGGLIGSAKSGASITDSYSGGHTENGRYNKANGDQIINVSGTVAGGLVGQAVSADIEYCYSTCSAGGSGYTGGLVGSAENGTVSNCYSTGAVFGTDPTKNGAFAGSLDGANTGKNDYYSIINEGMTAVASLANGSSDANVKPFDSDTKTYDEFLKSPTAFAYDSALVTEYKGKSDMPGILDIDKSTDLSDFPFIGNHYGDWPAPQTLIVNEPSNKKAKVSSKGSMQVTKTSVNAINISYPGSAAIPDGAILDASKVQRGTDEYNKLIRTVSSMLGADQVIRSAEFIDISILDNGKEIQPKDAVTVSLNLVNGQSNDKFTVIHFGETPEIKDHTKNNGVITFDAQSFSVYAIIDHEGDIDVTNPRVEFHFLHYNFTENTPADPSGELTYSVTEFYKFVNKGGTTQTSQILKNGEDLEMISNPPNLTIGGKPKYFFGWYVVEPVSGSISCGSVPDASNPFTYKWTDDPQEISFEKALTISPVSGVKVGDTVNWTVNGVSGSAVIDSEGTAHVFLAPIYEDYYFVNYHLGAKESDIWGTIMNRKLIVLGSDNLAAVHIGSMKAPSTDATRQVFSGWETATETTMQKTVGGVPVWDDGHGNETAAADCPDGHTAVMIDVPTATKKFFQSVDPTTGVEIDGYVDANTGAGATAPANYSGGYYIVVTKDVLDENRNSIDLYPVFAEARWIRFDTGKSGNGASYVSSTYLLTSNHTQGGEGQYNSTYFAAKLNVSSRPGYEFKGWYADAVMDINTGELTNVPSASNLNPANPATQITDGNGNVVSGSFVKYNSESKKTYELHDGKLYVYEELDSLTLYALWEPKTVEYTVVYWLENANDSNYALMTYTTKQGISGEMTAAAPLASDSATYTSNKLKFAHLSEDQDKEKAGAQAGIQQQEIAGDGTTVVNVYYDRNVYHLRFDIGFARKTGNNGTTPVWATLSAADAATYSGTVYGSVNGNMVALTPDGNGGWTYAGTVDVRNDYDGYRYLSTTGTDTPQYGIVNNAIVDLNVSVNYTGAAGRYTPETNNTGTQYGIIEGQITRIYFNNNRWYSTRTGWQNNYSYSNPYSGSRYTQRNDNNNGSYTGTVYYPGNGGFITETTYSSTPYGTNGTYYYPLNANNSYTYNSGSNYGNGTRYLRVDNGSSNTSYNLGFIGGEMKAVLHDDSGWYYNTQVPETVSYTGTLYKNEDLAGTWTFSVSNTTAPNYANGDNWDSFLTAHRYDIGTTNPFSASEYTGYYDVTEGGTQYIIFYYDLTAKYGEYIMDRYPGSQPARNNGNYVFVGWLAQRDSYYNARLSTSIKGFFETMSEDLILTGGTIPGWNVKNENISQDGYTAITINENNTITGEHGITQEFRCRYRGTNGYNYLYRIYLADSETLQYPAEPTMKIIITAGSGSNPNLQTPPTFYGYTMVSKQVLNDNGVGRTPDGNYSAYTVPELTAAGISGGMIMEFKFQPNEHTITFKKVNGDNFGPALTYNYNQSIASADIYTAEAAANPPEGHSFAGWFENNDGVGNAFDFNTTMPDGNIALYAIYKPLRYRVMIDPNGGVIDHVDHRAPGDSGYVDYYAVYGIKIYNGADDRLIGSGYKRDKSTYFNGTYGEDVGYYNMEGARQYVEITEVEAESLGSGNWYYYMNTQALPRDGSGLPSDLRNALYLTEADVDAYYEYYRTCIEANLINFPGSFVGMEPALGKEAWKDTYLEKNSSGNFKKYRPVHTTETYTFLGWYKINYDSEGNEIGPDPMPYNFDDPVENNFTLRAYWRLDGGYRILYTPEYVYEDESQGTVIINGDMEVWTDPQVAVTSYADGAATNIYRQPTGITADGDVESGKQYMFRGWRLVMIKKVNGTEIITPLENNVYYDPGDPFTIAAGYSDENGLIHFQAVYEKLENAYRRPDVASLTLRAINDTSHGFITDGTSPDELENDITLDWDGIGDISLSHDYETMTFAVTGQLQAHQQTGYPVHLYKYSTILDQDSQGNALDPVGKNYFKHPDGHFLLGFDKTEGENDFIADYTANSIISVQRSTNNILYAVWEPLVYVNIVNNTENTQFNSPGGDLTVSLSSSDGTALYIVNEKTGMFDREAVPDLSSIVVKNGETLRLAVPYGKAKELTVHGTNTLGTGILLRWQGELNGVTSGHPAGEANNGHNFDIVDTMVEDINGITITFTSIKADFALVLDDNYPNGNKAEVYFTENTTDPLFVENSYTLPSPGTRLGYEFLGWTLAPHADNSDVPVDYPVNDLDIANMRTDMFIAHDSADGKDDNIVILYAAWKAKGEAHKVYVYKDVPDPGDTTKLFTFTLNGSVTYTPNSGTASTKVFTPQPFVLAHNQYMEVYTVQTPKEKGAIATFEVTLTKYDALTDQPIDTGTYPILLKLEWQNTTGSGNAVGSFDNMLVTVEEDNYTSAYYDTDNTVTSVTAAEIVKENERRVKWTNESAGGLVVFTNTRQTVDVTVLKDVVGPTVIDPFNFEASYDYDGKHVTVPDFGIIAGTTGYKIEKVPVGAVLTIAEKGSDLLNYVTTAEHDGTPLTITADDNLSESTRTVTANILAEGTVKFTNETKAVKIRIEKIGFDGTNEYTDVEAIFKSDMFFDSDNVNGRYVSEVTSTNPRGNIIFETGVRFSTNTNPDPVIYVGDYTLRETRLYGTEYIKLADEIGISVVGEKEGGNDIVKVYVDNDKLGKAVTCEKVGDVWVIRVINRKTTPIKIRVGLLDPIATAPVTFSYTGQYEFNGTTYNIDSFTLRAIATADGSFSGDSAAQTTIYVPLGAENFRITEATSIFDTSVQRTYKDSSNNDVIGPRLTQNYYEYAVVVKGTEEETVTFFNARKTMNVTFTKEVQVNNPIAGELYSFTAVLKYTNKVITNYPIFINGTPFDSSDDGYTNSTTGEFTFTLTNYLASPNSYVLTIPVGTTLTVSETAASGPDGT